MQTDLKNVLVLCAPYGGITAVPMHSLAKMQAAGATVLMHQASADVSLTRCLQAGEAQNVLHKNLELEWVFWLDADMASDPSAVVTMIQYAEQLRDLQETGPKLHPSLSGCYMNRHRNPPQVSAVALKRAEIIELPLKNNDGTEHPAAPLIPALTGLGCFLQSREVFLMHCEESTNFHYDDPDHIVPQVCTSRVIHCSEYAQFVEVAANQDKWFWLGEDFDYCVRELEVGRLVYVAPTVFGHIDSIVLVPDDRVMFPGLTEPTSAPETRRSTSQQPKPEPQPEPEPSFIDGST